MMKLYRGTSSAVAILGASCLSCNIPTVPQHFVSDVFFGRGLFYGSIDGLRGAETLDGRGVVIAL